MNNDNYLIRLFIETMIKGTIEFYEQNTGNELTFECELEFYYSPSEKSSHDSPGCDEEITLTKITTFFGVINVDAIRNLDEVKASALDVMNREGEEYADSERQSGRATMRDESCL